MMDLSVIVPVYNMAKDGNLEYCIYSLVRQTLQSMEIIAVDDASTDDSLKILQEFEKRYPGRVKTIASPENRRQGGAKNLGLQRAKGRWIGFVDSDDWIAEDMFSKLLKKAEETGADVVGCNYLITDEIGKETGRMIRNNSAEQTGLLGEEQYKKLILHPDSMVVKVYRRELFEKWDIRFPERIFYEDNAISALPLLYASRFERVEEPLYFYYQHAGSTIHTVSMDRCEDRMKAMEFYKAEYVRRGFFEQYREEIIYKIIELGYQNTLFSYLQTAVCPSLSFMRKLRRFLLAQAPDYADNVYYKQYTDKESRKLIAMHMKSPVLFLIYYKLLHGYRRLRYGR